MGQPEIIYIGNYTIYDYGDHVDIEPPNDDLKKELESYGKYRMCLYSDYFEYNEELDE